MSFAQTVFKWLAHGRKPDASIGEFQLDASGALKVNTGAAGYPVSLATYDLGDRVSLVGLTSLRLYAFTASNEGSQTVWLQWYDATAYPGIGVTPLLSTPIPAGGVASGEFWASPILFSSGVLWGASSLPSSYSRAVNNLLVRAMVSLP